MAIDVVTGAYRAGAAFSRAVPRRFADVTAAGLSRLAASVSAERRMMVARHLRRVDPSLDGRALDRAVDETFTSYARYWIESFRLPGMSAEAVDFGFTVEGYRHINEGLDRGKGVILALPHLGGWEWAGFWLTLVNHVRVTVVVEPVEPPSLFEFFSEFRTKLGMEIVPLGPDAGGVILRALKANHIVCLLSDRDLLGDGVELEFFGETTTLPPGPATLALRTGAPLIPAAVYFEGRTGHLAIVEPPLDTERHGRLREDVARVTTDLAHTFEKLISRAPEQWHLQQPNWPSDYDALDAIGKPHPRPAHGPAAR